MKTSIPNPSRVARFLACAMLLLSGPALAEPQVETTVLAPLDALSLQVEPNGRVSAVVRQGSRFAVSVDGQVGPRFDRFLGSDAKPMLGRSQFPAAMGQDKFDHPVVFSGDGKRYAYAGLQGEEYVVMVDGQEVHRAPYQTGAIAGNQYSIVRFSPSGKRYWFIASHDLPGERPGHCLFVDGKPLPLRLPAQFTRELVFNKDETSYATSPDRGEMILNGKLAGYSAVPVTFLPNGKLLSVGETGALLDGKPLHPQLRRPVVSSTGRIAGVVSGGVWLDGKILPQTEGADTVQFSPDGTRVVVHGRSGNFMWQWLDGKRSENYSSFKNFAAATSERTYARFTADSSLCLSIAQQGGLHFPLVNGEESDGYKYIEDFVVAPQGNRFGYAATRTDNGSVAVIDSQVFSHPEWRVGSPNSIPTVVKESLTFSPDGKRVAFSIGSLKKSAHFIDGEQIDLQGHVATPWTSNAFTQGERASVLFSPDSKRAAFVSKEANNYHVRLDSKSIYHYENGTRSHPLFTPDSKHLFWFNRERATGRAGTDEVLYINGQRVAAFDLQTPPAQMFHKYVGSILMGDDGKLSIVTANPDGIVRHTVTPSATYDIAAAIAAAEAPSTDAASTTALALPAATVKAEPIRVIAQPIADIAPVEPLTWSQLVRKREAWPKKAVIQRELRFSDGAVVRSGSEIDILEVKANEIVASANRGSVTFAVEPDATNALESANATWSSFTPEQRELSYRSLVRRPDLWPYQLTLNVPIEFAGAPSLRAGDRALFLRYDRNQLLLRIPNTNIAFNLDPENTDLLERSRDALARPEGAKGRLLEEFSGKLVDPASGRAAEIQATHPQYVVLYMGAAWCPPCKIFAPKLAQVVKASQSSPDSVAFIYVSGDKTANEAKRYTAELGIDWPMLSFTDRGQLPAFESLFGDSIPQLVVTDRHGVVVIDSAKIGQERALSELQNLL